jgi:hypothetical protein
MRGRVTASSSREVNAKDDNDETKAMLAQLQGIADPQLLAFLSLQTKSFYKDKNGKQYKAKDKTKSSTSSAKSSSKFPGKCNYCNKKGHKENECRKKKSDEKKDRTNQRDRHRRSDSRERSNADRDRRRERSPDVRRDERREYDRNRRQKTAPTDLINVVAVTTAKIVKIDGVIEQTWPKGMKMLRTVKRWTFS